MQCIITGASFEAAAAAAAAHCFIRLPSPASGTRLAPCPCCLLPAGTQVPRTELAEMGPSLDLEVRRCRQPPVDLEKEANRRPKVDKKKVGAGPGRGLARQRVAGNVLVRRWALTGDLGRRPVGGAMFTRGWGFFGCWRVLGGAGLEV
jgi:hypothetical protein